MASQIVLHDATQVVIRDFPHYTIDVLLSAIERRDTQNLRVCTNAVLRSIFNHLFLSDYLYPDEGTGLALSHLITLVGDARRG